MNSNRLNFSKAVSILILSISLTACASGPTPVSASRPLIESVTLSQQDQIPEKWWGSFNTQQDTLTINHQDALLTIEPTYISALGVPCRLVKIERTFNVEIRTACRHSNGEWYINQPILRDNQATFAF